MRVAEARYVGPMRSHTRRTPSGTVFEFDRYPDSPEHEWVPITDVADAEYLSEQSAIELRWKPLGRVKAAGEDAVSAVGNLSYNVKQRLVGEDGFDLDVAGNAAEDDLDEALQQYVRDLHEEGEL